MIDVSECLSPLSRFLQECPLWIIVGGIIAVMILVFVAFKVRFYWYWDSTLWAIGCTALTWLVLLVVGLAIWLRSDLVEERQVYDLLGESYGIEQLECSDDACTWVKDGQPAAGTLVKRGDMAGLLDSNQTPLPMVGKGTQ